MIIADMHGGEHMTHSAMIHQLPKSSEPFGSRDELPPPFQEAMMLHCIWLSLQSLTLNNTLRMTTSQVGLRQHIHHQELVQTLSSSTLTRGDSRCLQASQKANHGNVEMPADRRLLAVGPLVRIAVICCWPRYHGTCHNDADTTQVKGYKAQLTLVILLQPCKPQAYCSEHFTEPIAQQALEHIRSSAVKQPAAAIPLQVAIQVVHNI